MAPSVLPSPTVSAAGARLYPYELTWPEDQLESEWRYAGEAWDGMGRIDHGGPLTDLVETTDGSLFAAGYPTDQSVEEFRDLVAGQAAVWHGCDREPVTEEPMTGGGAEGIYGEYRCRASTVHRWFGVHNGFALFVAMIVAPAAGVDIDEVGSRFRQHVGALEWTN